MCVDVAKTRLGLPVQSVEELIVPSVSTLVFLFDAQEMAAL